MSRTFIINEIHNIYLSHLTEKNKKEDKLFKTLLTKEEYISKNYSYLLPIFKKHAFPSEKWHELVRECLYYDKEDITYLTGRVFLLLNRYCDSQGSFLEINNNAKSQIFPRFQMLLRLLELHKELLFDILPKLKTNLTYNIHESERYGRTIVVTLTGKKH